MTIIRNFAMSWAVAYPMAVSMIVCVCNRLNEAKVLGAIACGASSPEQVYAHNGVAKVCGTCHETIEAMLQQAHEEVLEAAE